MRGNAMAETSKRYVDMLKTFIPEQLKNISNLHKP